MVNQLSTAPLKKNYQIGARERLPTRRDVRDLTQSAVTQGEIRFFREGAEADEIGRHYNQPLSGGAKRILGLGFTLTHPILKSSANVDVFAIANALRHSAVRLEIGDNNTTVLKGHLADFVQFNKTKVVDVGYDDGTNSGSVQALHVRTVPIRRLADTSIRNTGIKDGQRFNLAIRPDNADPIPQEGDWTTGTVPQILCQMQLGYPEGAAPGELMG